MYLQSHIQSFLSEYKETAAHNRTASAILGYNSTALRYIAKAANINGGSINQVIQV